MKMNPDKGKSPERLAWESGYEQGFANAKAMLEATPAQAQQAGEPHLFELWWERHMPEATQAQAWRAWIAAPRADGVGVAATKAERAHPYGRCTITGPAEDVAFIFRHLPDVNDKEPAPEATPLPEGWQFNHARQQTDDDGPVSGVWEIGWLEVEDDYFAPILTVDTGLYYQDKDAEPLAKAILERLAGQGKEASNPANSGGKQ